MAQFRSGILPLEIETGRYRHIDVCERFCFYCKTLVENELHFVLICPLYTEERHSLINQVTLSHNMFDNLDEIQKLNILLNNFWKHTSKFLNKAWNIRSNLICQN